MPNLTPKRKNNLFITLLSSIIIIGISLRLLQYFANKDLWLDEAVLALNIISKNYIELAGKLNYGQFAPVLFLWIEKYITDILGNHELALRLFPLFCSISALFVLPGLFYNLFQQKIPVLIGVFLLAFNIRCIWYGSEVKQYALDMLVALLLFYLTTSNEQLIKKYRYPILGIIGSIGIFLSNITLFILPSIFLLLVIELFQKETKDWVKLWPTIFWVFAFGAFYWLFITGETNQKVMKNYWAAHFAPESFWKREYWYWLWQHLKDMVNYFFNLSPKSNAGGFIMGLSCFSIIAYVFKKKLNLLIISLLPILVALSLSYFHLYPFSDRLILFLLPSVLLLVTSALFYIYTFIRFYLPTFIAYLPIMAFVVYFPLISFKPLPMEFEEIRESLDFMKIHVELQYPIYIYYSSEPAFTYYEKAGFYKFKNKKKFGKRSRKNKAVYLQEIAAFHGQKVWLLFTHNYGDEEKFIIKNLQNKGGKILKKHSGLRNSCYLIDLSSLKK